VQGWRRQYQPTIAPSPLIPEATVTTAPGTSIFVVVSGLLPLAVLIADRRANRTNARRRIDFERVIFRIVFLLSRTKPAVL